MTLFRTSANSLGGDTLITAVTVNAKRERAGNTLITIAQRAGYQTWFGPVQARQNRGSLAGGPILIRIIVRGFIANDN
jgi:hypothetical protein